MVQYAVGFGPVAVGEGSRGDSDTGANALRDALAALGFHRSNAAAASRATRSTDASRIEPAVS